MSLRLFEMLARRDDAVKEAAGVKTAFLGAGLKALGVYWGAKDLAAQTAQGARITDRASEAAAQVSKPDGPTM